MFCNYVAKWAGISTFVANRYSMNRFRSYFAWLLLVAVTVISLPRTWVHDCNNTWEERHQQSEKGTHDQVDHESCPICDYSPASSFSEIFLFDLLAPPMAANIECAFPDAISSAALAQLSLRGPPLAVA
jgi:hypothetical protein